MHLSIIDVGMIFLLGISLLILSGSAPADSAACGIDEIKQYVVSNQRIPLLPSKYELHDSSGNRHEVYFEEGFQGYAVVSYQSDERRMPALMDRFCNLALIRKGLQKIEFIISPKTNNQLQHELITQFAAGETQVRNVKSLGRHTEHGCHLKACTVNLSDVNYPDYARRSDAYLAQSGYQLAKKSLANMQYDEALELLKYCKLDQAVFQNAVAYLIPLMAFKLPEKVQELEGHYLELGQINDPDALIYLGQYYRRQFSFESALAVFEHCLTLQPDHPSCLQDRDATLRQLDARERDEATDFDAIIERL